MKKPVFLNTVGKKYATGYIIMGIFVLVFFAVGLAENSYISKSYSKAVSELVSINNLEKSVNSLNETVNMTYLYLSAEGTEGYASAKEETERYLEEAKDRLYGRFVRELADTCMTIDTYVDKSNELMGMLEEYRASKSHDPDAYKELEIGYGKLQEVYSYINQGFQDTYTVELGALSGIETELGKMQDRITVFQIILISLAAGICLIYLAKVIGEVSRSIEKMMKGVDSIKENLSEAKPICMDSSDEFDEFADAFNRMIKIIQEQMKKLEENADVKERLAALEIKNLRIYNELQKSHLNFLQARINPHFLFNTLNMISSLARIENADKCADLMEITASFLRYNLDNISKTVTLRKEVENLKDYVAIQRYRYDERYACYFEIDESCLDFKMPCMILQPLVENAIRHGIGMMSEGGCVFIKAAETPDGILLEVRDNGIGMTEEQIKEINEELEKNNHQGTHIGLRNVYGRLKLFYNDDVRIKIENMYPGLKIDILFRKGGVKTEITMVIADDEPVVLKSWEMFIKKEFPEIKITGLAKDGILLKEMVEKYEPDIAIADIRMPGLSGIEAIELLRNKEFKTHFIISSAYSDFEYAKKALDLKTDAYLLKPGKREEKIEVISKLLRAVKEEKQKESKQVHLNSALSVVNPVLGSEILLSIFSEKCDERDFDAYLNINSIKFHRGCIVTFLHSRKGDMGRRTINEELVKLLDGICEFLAAVTDEGTVIMLFVPEFLQGGAESWCEDVAALIAEDIREHTNEKCRYGVGDIYNTFLKMPDSYRDSIKKLQEEKRLSPEMPEDSADRILFYVEKAKRYIKENFQKDISLMDCAENAEISPWYLSRIFKEKTGKTVVEYLTEIRMAKAMSLCENSALTIKDISERCGYLNTTYFCKVFKKNTGKTIGEYKKETLKENAGRSERDV